MVVSYAESSDVADRWRPLSEAEDNLASVLVIDASYKVRRRFPTVDARITSGELAAVEVTAVVAGMVKRAMLTAGAEGVTERSEGTGPFSASEKYANPMGNLYFTADDLEVLSDPNMGSRRAFSVDLTPGL